MCINSRNVKETVERGGDNLERYDIRVFRVVGAAFQARFCLLAVAFSRLESRSHCKNDE
jgi:hypothetical protein